jgi:hypothetical protein
MMKDSRFVRWLLLALVLTVLPLSSGLLAQEALTETFTTADGAFTFAHPDGWFVEDSGEAGLYLANSADAIDSVFSGAPESGVLVVIFAPAAADLQGAPDGITAASSPEEVATLLQADLLGDLNPADGDELSDVTQVILNDRRAYRFDGFAGAQGVTIAVLAHDTGEAVSIMIAYSVPEDFAAFEPTLLAIAETMQSQPPSETPAIGSTSPQGGTIAYGDVVETNIGDAAGDRYTFEGVEGDIVTIRMEGNFDTFLELYDASDTMLISDDDSAGDLNSLIDSFVLPADGVYTIVARPLSSMATGKYTLSLSAFDMSSLRSPGPIAIGETVMAELNGITGDIWTFVGNEGDAIQIEMDAKFDNYLELFDEDNSQLITDDDSAGNGNARIVYTLPADGTYSILARSYSSGVKGIYTLELSTLTIANRGALNYGDVVRTETVNALGDHWTFMGEEGDVISIAMFADFDTELLLLDAENNQLAQDLDYISYNSSLIDAFTLPADGAYTIVAKGYGGTMGPYVLMVGRKLDVE